MTEADTPGIRLQKVLAQAGVCSRRGGEALISAGRVQVNDRVVTELGTRVDPARDRIAVDGREVQVADPVYIVLHKPDGVVSSGEPDRDPRGRATVVSLVKGIRERIFPVGRLDYHTRGVLLLTNDGELSGRLTHPRYEVEKTYHVKLQGKLDDATLEALLSGVTLEDGTQTKPARELVVVRETATNTWVQITITQGLNRQLRRMGEAVGHPVLKLIRVSFADITNDDLDEGDWRRCTEAEVARLRRLVKLGRPDAADGAEAGGKGKRGRAAGEDAPAQAPKTGARGRTSRTPRRGRS